jgi:hypothetical protein
MDDELVAALQYPAVAAAYFGQVDVLSSAHNA